MVPIAGIMTPYSTTGPFPDLDCCSIALKPAKRYARGSEIRTETGQDEEEKAQVGTVAGNAQQDASDNGV